MKVVSLLLSSHVVVSTQDGYGVPYEVYPPTEAGPAASYGEQPPSSYGYSPYGAQGGGYGPDFEEFIDPVFPQKQKPNPFVDYPADEAKNELHLPHLGQSHCFLKGAPFTSCGRRSLTSYFLEQCMSFYYSMATNVDGICGKDIPEPAAAPVDEYDLYGVPTAAAPTFYPPQYGVDQPTEPATEPATEATIGYSGAVIGAYQKERCLQNAFVSITAATVMCLTENMIRIKFIEHYAKNAATNPIEGPILYLKKLHVFIRSVLKCNNRKAKYNFPNLWLEFQNDDGVVTYNPNAPYEYVDGQVQLPDATDAASIGFEDSIIDNYFICNNPTDLHRGGQYYNSDPGNPRYSKHLIHRCARRSRTSSALNTIGKNKVLKKCEYANDEPNSSSDNTIGPESQKLTDMDLRGLYDGVNPVTRTTQSSYRVRSIAEMAVLNAGVLGQPILEGFGIMYFCAFYACKANNGGEVDGTCLPTFDADSDWRNKKKDELKTLSEKVDNCLEKKWITKNDVAMDGEVERFNQKSDRSYICMAESKIVRFFNRMTDTDSNEAWDLVYYRHLAIEKCYESKKNMCTSNKKLYKTLRDALSSLVGLCNERQAEYHAAALEHAEHKSGYYAPASAYPPVQG